MVRLEWGADGALALARHAVEHGEAVYAVVVDVLSFTTSVTVAADVGRPVYPYRWSHDGAADFAEERSAVLAQPRSRTRGGGISLSPSSIRSAAGNGAIVLPSPNGSTTTETLADTGTVVVAASLRNRAAVGDWLVERLGGAHGPSGVVLLVPSGERWPDGSLRPAVEDLWGAGGVARALTDAWGHRARTLSMSPEAQAASATYDAVQPNLTDSLANCASGRELVDSGWSPDVAIASELDASTSVPVLHEGAYRLTPLLPDGRPEG